MKDYLGELEEFALLTIAALGDEAYGAGILKEIETRLGRSMSLGALHSTLTRLEEKGFVKSKVGGATHERGGRRKRYYTVTMHGKKALNHVRNLRNELWILSEQKLSMSK